MCFCAQQCFPLSRPCLPAAGSAGGRGQAPRRPAGTGAANLVLPEYRAPPRPPRTPGRAPAGGQGRGKLSETLREPPRLLKLRLHRCPWRPVAARDEPGWAGG